MNSSGSIRLIMKYRVIIKLLAILPGVGIDLHIFIDLGPEVGINAEISPYDFPEESRELFTGYRWMIESLKNTMSGRLFAMTTLAKSVKGTVDENLRDWEKNTIRSERNFTKSKSQCIDG